MIEVIQGDCLEVMRGMKDNSVDLVLTDPPYGISIDSEFQKTAGTFQGNGVAMRKDYGSTNRDSDRPNLEYFSEIQRISKNAIIFGGNYFADILPASRCWLVRDKNNGSNNFADCELARTNFETSVRMFKRTRNGMLQEDMSNKELREHPTQKPVGLFNAIIDKYSEPGMKVLDCFAGSGTTGIACKQMGRDCILIEKEPKYIEVINKRLSSTTTSLFA